MRRAIVAVAAVAAAVTLAAPAGADDGDMPPCGLRLMFLCNMVPTYPDLDHDVDLTQDPHALDGLTSDPDPALQPQG